MSCAEYGESYRSDDDSPYGLASPILPFDAASPFTEVVDSPTADYTDSCVVRTLAHNRQFTPNLGSHDLYSINRTLSVPQFTMLLSHSTGLLTPLLATLLNMPPRYQLPSYPSFRLVRLLSQILNALHLHLLVSVRRLARLALRRHPPLAPRHRPLSASRVPLLETVGLANPVADPANARIPMSRPTHPLILWTIRSLSSTLPAITTTMAFRNPPHQMLSVSRRSRIRLFNLPCSPWTKYPSPTPSPSRGKPSSS